MEIAKQIRDFWLDEVGPKGWYVVDDTLDQSIRDRFLHVWEEAIEGGCGLWLTDPKGALAYLILTDQFPRNMFRGDGRSFATDRSARAAAKAAIDRDWDRAIGEPARQFFYMPLMHSENLVDQDRGVRLIHSRLENEGGSTLVHAKVHRSIIRQFGRFPFRNAVLDRTTTQAEQQFMDDGGYGAAFRLFSDAG
ncbi:MAG: DUF924 domain-containing protein [Yoonia sp.]|nr:DUF924 domain-containing protein [Yoonia sp.]